jgi:hypothetical protein
MFRSNMTLSAPLRLVSFLVALVTLGVLLGSLVTVPPAATIGPILALVVAVPTLVVAWAMAPRAVAVDAGELLIERRAWWPRRVRLDAIRSAGPYAGGRGVRVMGVGGFFGNYGAYYAPALGRFSLYSTRSGMAVIVRRSDGVPLVLTPDDVDGTIAAIDRRPVEA